MILRSLVSIEAMSALPFCPEHRENAITTASVPGCDAPARAPGPRRSPVSRRTGILGDLPTQYRRRHRRPIPRSKASRRHPRRAAGNRRSADPRDRADPPMAPRHAPDAGAAAPPLPAPASTNSTLTLLKVRIVLS